MKAVRAAIVVAVAAGVTAVGVARTRPDQTNPITAENKPRPREVAPLFDPATAQTLLDEPGRDAWQKPDEIVRALRIRPGDVVADVGAGSGYLMSRLSRAVGLHGTVYAEEIQKEFVRQLTAKAKGFRNVRVVAGAADDPKLPFGRIDHFLLLTVYHEVQKPVAFLRTLKRYASPKAELAIIDFDARRNGSPPAPMGHELSEKDVITEAGAAGWRLAAKHEFLSSQFFLLFRPQ